MFVALAACGPKSQPAAATGDATDEVKSYDIAYIQVEAVLAESDLYKKEGAALQEKTQKAQNSWAQREKNLQAEAAKLQEKYQKGSSPPTMRRLSRRASSAGPLRIRIRLRRRPARSTRRISSSPTGRRTFCSALSTKSTPTGSIS